MEVSGGTIGGAFSHESKEAPGCSGPDVKHANMFYDVYYVK